MEQSYIEILRNESVYIKLQADIKFGGAVDINSLIQALSSLNLSYKKFLEIELSKNADIKTTTKASKKELDKLIADSELLIVDLDFASFGAAISPNTVTSNQYFHIKNSLQVKRQAFNTYKHDVLSFNYDNKKFIESIIDKYTIEERNEIFKPIIDNLVNSKKFQLYYGQNKQHLKNISSSLKESIVAELIQKPSVKKIESKKEEDIYIMYVTSSDEVDLFGKKPKFSKVLATSKLDKAVYPYQLNEIKFNNSILKFENKLSATVDFDDDMFFITYPDLNIEVWGDDRKEAEDAFNFALQSIIKNIYNEKDENLTERALQLKKRLNTIIKFAVD